MMPLAFSSSQHTPLTVTPFSRPTPRSTVSPAETVIGALSCSAWEEKSMTDLFSPVSLALRLKPHFSGRDTRIR